MHEDAPESSVGFHEAKLIHRGFEAEVFEDAPEQPEPEVKPSTEDAAPTQRCHRYRVRAGRGARWVGGRRFSPSRLQRIRHQEESIMADVLWSVLSVIMVSLSTCNPGSVIDWMWAAAAAAVFGVQLKSAGGRVLRSLKLPAAVVQVPLPVVNTAAQLTAPMVIGNTPWWSGWMISWTMTVIAASAAGIVLAAVML